MSGIKPGDDLNDIETFLFAVGSERFEFIRPMQPMAKSHPPGIAQPEKWRAVRVLQETRLSQTIALGRGRIGDFFQYKV